MRHTVPFARTDGEAMSTDRIVEWFRVDELLSSLSELDPKVELPLLLEFLVQYAGGLELAELDMTETLTEQAATKYKAYAFSVRKIKSRILKLYELD